MWGGGFVSGGRGHTELPAYTGGGGGVVTSAPAPGWRLGPSNLNSFKKLLFIRHEKGRLTPTRVSLISDCFVLLPPRSRAGFLKCGVHLHCRCCTRGMTPVIPECPRKPQVHRGRGDPRGPTTLITATLITRANVLCGFQPVARCGVIPSQTHSGAPVIPAWSQGP